MDEVSVKRALVEAIKEGAIQELIRNEVRAAVIEAVKFAVAQKDAEITSLREELKGAKEQLNDLEQYSRRLCLNISGIPEGGPNEVTDRLVIDTAKMAVVTVASQDIDISHRIGVARAGTNRTIIVRFNSFKTRQEVYNARRELRKPRPVPG